MQPEGKQSRADFIRKLGYYAVGIAVGFALLGIIQKKRANEVQRRKAEEAARAAMPSTIFPPLPGEPSTPTATPPTLPTQPTTQKDAK